MINNMPPKTTNAADRLYSLLSKAQGISGGNTYQQFSKVFEIDASDHVGLLRNLIHATEAIDEIDSLVTGIPHANRTLYLKGLDHLKKGFAAAAANGDFNHWKANYLRPEQIQPLEYCADLLARYYPELEIPQDEISKVTEQVNDVYNSVVTSGISPELKMTILDLLEKVRRAIHDYRIRGVYELQDALALATGQMVLHGKEVQDAKTSSDKPTIEKLFKLLEYVDKITAAARKCKPLFHLVTQYSPAILEKGREVIDKVRHHG